MRSALQWPQENATSKRSIFLYFGMFFVFCLFTFLFVCLYVFLFVCFQRDAVVENIFELMHTAGKTEQGRRGAEEENPALRFHPQVSYSPSQIHCRQTQRVKYVEPLATFEMYCQNSQNRNKIQSRREIQNNGFLEDSPRERKWGKHNLSRQPGAISILFNNLSSPYDRSGR